MDNLFLGFKISTIVTDVLALIGVIILIFGSLFFLGGYQRMLSERLFRKKDAKKIYESIKYDLKISKDIDNFDYKLLFSNPQYGVTLFKNAMEYNLRSYVTFTNERVARNIIYESIAKKAWLNFLTWILVFAVAGASAELDLVRFIFHDTFASDNGKIAIGFNLTLGFLFTGLLKYLEFKSVRRTLDDKIHAIDLNKKTIVWRDYKVLFYCQIGFVGVGLLLVIVNQFF